MLTNGHLLLNTLRQKITKGFNGSTCSERGCDVSGIGSVKEKIFEYSDTEHVLSYEVYVEMPKMVIYMTNYWKLTPIGKDKVKLEMRMEMKNIDKYLVYKTTGHIFVP